LALFDARIFASGHLMAEAPPQWRSFVPALEPMFMLQTPGHRFWASGYLPVNAALQAIGIAIRLNGLISPLLAGLAVVSTWAVGRRLWPDRPNAALVAAMLLATSSQFLVTAMTPYAMTAPSRLEHDLAVALPARRAVGPCRRDPHGLPGLRTPPVYFSSAVRRTFHPAAVATTSARPRCGKRSEPPPIFRPCRFTISGTPSQASERPEASRCR